MKYRKTIRHVHEPGDFHEFTFSCYQRRPLLAQFRRYEELAPVIDQACRELSFDLVAFVYMPEHLHLLVLPRLDRPELPLFLARIKQPFSKVVKGTWETSRPEMVKELTLEERPGKFCFRFWQAGPGYDRNLNHPKEVLASIDYLHENPVRRGLCSRAIDWPWSSARYYLGEPPRKQYEGLQFVHGLPIDALDRSWGQS